MVLNQLSHFEVILHNCNNEYGITLSGGSDHNTPLYISKVKVGTSAYDCRLRKRDIILSINNYNCIDCRHNTAVNLIKLNSEKVKFLIYRSNKNTSNMESLFQEMTTYIHNMGVKLGQPIDDTLLQKISNKPCDSLKNNNHSNKPSKNIYYESSENLKNNSKNKNYTSKTSISSVGSDWYKSYATSTINAKSNVTVKDIMRIERGKSLHHKSYLKPTNSVYYKEHHTIKELNSDNKSVVKSLVNNFNGKPDVICNGYNKSQIIENSNGISNHQTHGPEAATIPCYANNCYDNRISPSSNSSSSQNVYPSSPKQNQHTIYEGIAIDDYVARGPIELNLNKGDKITILRSIDNNWYEGYVDEHDIKIIPKHIVAIEKMLLFNGNIEIDINNQPQSNNSL